MLLGACAQRDGAGAVAGHERLLGVDQQVEQHLLQLRPVAPDLGIGSVELERDRDVERGQVVRSQREGAPGDVVQVHEGPLAPARAREREEIGRDASDARRLVMNHFDHLTLLGLQVLEHQRLRKTRNDRRGVVDLVRHAADQLPHGRELFGLLQLRLRAPQVGDVPRQREHLADGPALAHGRVDHRADPTRTVRADERDFEPSHFAGEGCVEVLPDDPLDGVVHAREHGAVRGRVARQRHELRPRGVEIGHPAFPVEQDDGVGDRLHDEPQMPLGRRGGGQRVEQRAGLGGNLPLQGFGVAAFGADREHDAEGDAREPEHQEHGHDPRARPRVGGDQAVGKDDRGERGDADRDQRCRDEGARPRVDHGA